MSRRIYAAASGQCLVRDTSEVDEAEREQVEQDYHAGVRLVVDDNRHEVRGFVPVRRRSPEAFYAVVRAPDDDADPLETFYYLVADEFERRDHWALDADRLEAEPFRRALAGKSPLTADESPPALRDGLSEPRMGDGPITVAVGDYLAAIGCIAGLSDADVSPYDIGTVAVVREPGVSHLDPAVQVWIREGQESPAVVDLAEVRDEEVDNDRTARVLSPIRIGGALFVAGCGLFVVGTVAGSVEGQIAGTAALMIGGLVALRG